MNKITKKEYNTRKTELNNKIKTYSDMLKAIENKINDDNTSVEDQQTLGENWNNLYDFKRDLEKELDSLEDEWERRNWTFSDYMQHSLICNNID
jgi:uncharacterized protein YukE